jgi:hypothetical protein
MTREFVQHKHAHGDEALWFMIVIAVIVFVSFVAVLLFILFP